MALPGISSNGWRLGSCATDLVDGDHSTESGGISKEDDGSLTRKFLYHMCTQ